MSSQILTDFRNLERSNWPSDSAELTVQVDQLKMAGQMWIGKGTQDLPFVLIATSQMSIQEPEQRLKHIHLSHQIECRVKGSLGEETQFQVAIASCLDPDYAGTFLSFCVMLGQILEPNPSPRTVTRHVLRLADLLAFASSPSEQTQRGYWAELFLMRESTQPDILLSAWHVDTKDRHDFVYGSERIEVKSCGVRGRKHDFSHEQLLPIDGHSPLVASVKLQSANGPTVADLVHELLGDQSISRKNKGKLVDLTLETLGVDWIENTEMSFDEELARGSLRFYWATELPQIPEPIPAAVTDLRYSVEIPAELESVDARDFLRDVDTPSIFGAIPIR